MSDKETKDATQRWRELLPDSTVREELMAQIEALGLSRRPFTASLLLIALAHRNLGRKFKVRVVVPERRHCRRRKNPDFNIQRANDGFEGEWCGNPEYIRECVLKEEAVLVVDRDGELIPSGNANGGAGSTLLMGESALADTLDHGASVRKTVANPPS